MTLLIVFGLLLLLPVFIYALKASKLISERTTDIVIGAMCMVFGSGFLAFAAYLWYDSGVILRPAKHGPLTVTAGSDFFREFQGITMCLFLGGGMLWAGWSFLIPKRPQQK